MQFPIVREYKTDIQQKNEENKVVGEPVAIPIGKESWVIVLRHAPFFVDSLKLTTEYGQPLEEGKDYEIYKIMPKLTALAATDVASMILFKNKNVTAALADYHVVGDFPLIDTTFMEMLAAAINDDRPVWWDNLTNKPVGFVPPQHGHSLLYDITSFDDTIALLNDVQRLIETTADPLGLRIEHYMKLVDHYINLYGGMLDKFLSNHKNAIDAHGLQAKQVGLENVDNFETASFLNVTQGRADQHLRPTELKTLIESYSFNTEEFLAAKTLPISQFGNTNFIPPNVDGSYEGFGSIYEGAGICLESDSSIVYLWNRMDGRTRGLYYSVLTGTDNPDRAELLYTGYKYTHPRFVPDATNVDLIAPGSGDQVILVGDSEKNIFYVGLTNGSLDPTKHVYSKVDLRGITSSLYIDPSVPANRLFPYLTVALMGDWIYLIQSSRVTAPDPTPLGGGMNYKQFYRVKVSDVQKTLDVTPVRQNISFTNAEGDSYTNSPFYRWYENIYQGDRVLKSLMRFSPYLPNGLSGNYRTQATLAAEDPARKGTYGLKFLSAWHVAISDPGVVSSTSHVFEINYDFDPKTGVMTFKSKTDLPDSVDLSKSPVIPSKYEIPANMFWLVFTYAGQGINVMEDGRLAASGAYGFSGFPVAGLFGSVPDSNTRYATVSRLWSNMSNGMTKSQVADEVISSPLESSINVKSVMYRPGEEYYTAAGKTQLGTLYLYQKKVTGKFALRPEVTNLRVPNVVSRPLTTSIRRVNAPPGLGGCTVSVPSAKLDTYGVDVGESTFCMGTQKRYFDRTRKGADWGDDVGLDDIILISSFTPRNDPDGTVTIVPNAEILYPAAIVNLLKSQAQYPDKAATARQCIVTVCDPSLSSLDKFGWLPVTVGISYATPFGTEDQFTYYTTFMVIQPTYMVVGKRRVVTGFTVLDKLNAANPQWAIFDLRVFDGLYSESPLTTIGSMRTFYYLDGNKLEVYFNAGVVGQTTGDAIVVNGIFRYDNRDTRRWSYVSWDYHTSNGGGVFISPDNGINRMLGWAATTGGAATIIDGAVNKPLVGSVYPETGWIIFFKTAINVVFNGESFVLPVGTFDLRDVDPAPQNKTFYVYAKLVNGVAMYEVSQEKRLESNYQLWCATAITNDKQIITIERYNVMAIDGHRISETKRGNSIPASSGLIDAEGQLPWLRPGEYLPG